MKLSWFVYVLKGINTSIPSNQKLDAVQKVAHCLPGPNFVRISERSSGQVSKSFGSTPNAGYPQNGVGFVAELFNLYASKDRTQMLDRI